MPENATEGDRLLSAADTALYEAKRSGRDCVATSVREAGAVTPVVVRLDEAQLARGA